MQVIELRALAGVAALAVALGCGDVHESRSLGVRLRFLEEEPELVLQGDRSTPLDEVFFRELSVPLPVSRSGRGAVELDVGFVAQDVDRVAIEAAPTGGDEGARPELLLSWANADGDLAADGGVVASRSRPWGSGRWRYVFDLVGHPEWHGEVGRLEIRQASPSRGTARLLSVAGLARDRGTGPGFANRAQTRVLLDWRRIDTSRDEAWVEKTLVRSGDDGADAREVLFTKRVDLQANYFSDFEVVLEGLELLGWRRPLHLLWSGPDEGFSTSRRLTGFLQGDATSDGRARYRFHTRGHDAWRGRIGQLRLVFGAGPTERIRLARFTGFGDRPSRSHLERAVREGFQVTLDDERRAALPAARGLPIERTLEVGSDYSLRFAVGAPEGSPLPVSFRVLAAGAGEEPRVIFERVLTRPGETDRWFEERVDLGAYAGRTTRLKLDTEVELPPGSSAIPAWAHPEVLGPLAGAPPPNVLLVVVDTLRADRLSLYGYERPTSPHLDAWAKDRAAVFSSTVAPAPWTLPSHLSLFSGIDAVRFGRPSSAPSGVPLLAGLLRRAGYATAAVTGGGYLHPDFGFARGFERFRFYSGARPEGARDASQDEDAELEGGVEHALEVLGRQRDRPFFLFFHTYETHMPFLPREPFFSRFSDLPPTPVTSLHSEPKREENGFMRLERVPADLPPGVDPSVLLSDLYDSGVAYTDLHLGRLLEWLDKSGLAGNTVVVVTSDHGELFGEHGLAAHTSLYDENLLVPLLITDPRGRGAGSFVDRQVRLVDILPTILDLVGLPAPTQADGVSLLPLMAGGPANVPDTAWSYASSSNFGLSIRQANRWKYTFNNTAWPAVHGAEELLRLGDRDSPPMRVEDPEALARFRRLARARLESEPPGLEVVLTNRGATELRVTLAGPLLATNSVKSSEPTCPCPTWEAGRATVELPAGSATSLRLEAERPASLGLRLQTPSAGPDWFEASLEPEELRQGIAFELQADRWSRRPHGLPWAEANPGIELRWRPGTVAAATGDPEMNEALRRRLEALGYLQ